MGRINDFQQGILAYATILWSKLGSVRSIYYYLKGVVAYTKILRYKKHSTLNELTYRILWDLSFYSKHQFLKYKDYIVKQNTEQFRKKSICKVGFIVYTPSMWSVDGLYKMMEKDSQYQPSVLVVPFTDDDKKAYENTKDYFIKRGYNVETPDSTSFNIDAYDILIYTNPYINYINVFSISLDKLIVYVSYSYILSDKIEKIDYPICLLSWKFFCDSEFYKRLVENKSRVYSDNAVFCGYPKMDSYYLSEVRKDNKSKGRKVVIYAPHQSVNYTGIKSATFEKNGWFLLYLAEKYKDKLYWIIKPHPLLRSHSVMAGLFQNEDNYTDYLKRWEDFGAAEVVENGDYFSLFKESDAMITDSVSFLAEYQFTGKPLLLLESGRQTYNDFGNSIKDILYCCDGNDYSGIESFLDDVINGQDVMKEIREGFFNSNLSHSHKDGVLANENVYNIINLEIFAN